MTVVASVAAPVLLIAFVVTESRVRAPVLPLGVFRASAFSAAVVNGFAFQYAAYGLQFLLVVSVQSRWDYDAFSAGLLFVPFAVLWTFATLVLNRRWAGRGMRWLLITGSVIAAVGSVICVGVDGPDSLPVLLVGTAIVGFGCGLFGPSCNGAAMAAADRDFAGLASGVLNTARQVGMAGGGGARWVPAHEPTHRSSGGHRDDRGRVPRDRRVVVAVPRTTEFRRFRSGIIGA
ncbi:MFS transporter [Nocardia sp. AG03]|uniref:MFS transporter n=1 Tax=Nocardia sp. AG03 TaxID=3025312 RepID=UPI00241832A2|nr:MFS transporter [Nocardia sp. AG03]